MLSTFFNNLQETIRTRPPLTLFTLSLISLAVACFSLAYYVGNADTVINRDEQMNWEYFLKHLNKKQYCITKKQNSASTNVVIGRSTVYIPAQLSFLNGIANFSNVRGSLLIDNWKPSCRPVPPNTTVELSFNIPDISVINKTSHDICVILDVPSDFLVQFSESKCISDFSITGSIGALTAISLNDANEEFCKNGEKARLYFNERRSKTFEIFLTQAEKIDIYINLMWLSSIISLIVIIIFCYALLVKNNNRQRIYKMCFI